MGELQATPAPTPAVVNTLMNQAGLDLSAATAGQTWPNVKAIENYIFSGTALSSPSAYTTKVKTWYDSASATDKATFKGSVMGGTATSTSATTAPTPAAAGATPAP